MPELRSGSFFAPGAPLPQPRPRAVNVNGFPQVVSNAGAAIKRWKRAVHTAAVAAETPLLRETRLGMMLAFHLEPPRSLLRKDGTLRKGQRADPTGARDGDLDNLVKPVLDSLLGVLFEDDSWVLVLSAAKCWALAGQPPGVRVAWHEHAPLPLDEVLTDAP